MFGDSTMANYDESTDRRGWGQLFGMFLKDGVTCLNMARSGYDSRSGYNIWNNMKETVSPGDYVIIQFAHNDEKQQGMDCYELRDYYTRLGLVDKVDSLTMRGTTPYGTYKEILTQFVNDVKAKGANPILMSSFCRCDFAPDGKITRKARHDLGDRFSILTSNEVLENQMIDIDDHTMDYVFHMRTVAEQAGVPFVNLTTSSVELVESYGAEYVNEWFNLLDDHTHFSKYGAFVMARLAASLLTENGLLEDCINKEAINRYSENEIPPFPYAVYEDGTLTFYYDNQSDTRTGEVYTNITRNGSSDKWGVHNTDIKNVVFDPQFIYARPISTAYWFHGCKNIIEITGLNFLNTSNVTTMYAMFNAIGMSSKKITELDLTNFNTNNVVNMGSMFKNANGLKTIKVGSNWTTDNVTSSGNMFYECTNIVGGDGTTFNANYIDKTLAFAGQGGYLTFSNESVISEPIPYAVYEDGILTFYCDNQYERRTGDVYTNILRKKKTDEWGEHRDEIEKVVFNSSFANARPLSTAHWFNGCKVLTSISGMGYLNTTEVTTMYAMFNGCSLLTNVYVSMFDTSKVTNMGYMFNSCPQLTALNLKSFDTSNVTNMNYMFNSCASLQTIEVGPNWNTDNVTTSTRMFTACKKLMGSDATRYNADSTEKEAANTGEHGYLTGNRRAYAVYNDGLLTFYYDDQYTKRVGNVYTYLIRTKSGDLWGAHKADVTKVEFDPSFADTHPGSLYHWFNGFKSMTIISGIEYLNTSDVTTLSCMFNGCKAIKTLDLTRFDTGKITNMGYMFNSCSLLKKIYVSDLWTTDKVRSSDMMFYGCKTLVGGDGTKYNSNYIDKAKAYTGRGGYLTYYAIDAKKFNDTDFDTTAIDDINNLMATSTADVYTLQGIHVGKNVELNTLPMGIYIINGKKLMIK